jgi:mRNA interferase MazF
MTRRSVTCEPWQVVVVPFPFTDRATTRRRPALVLSARAFNRHGHSVLAMITSASHPAWPGDGSLEDLKGAGLKAPSVVRLKLFTLDNRLIARRIGVLGSRDRAAVARALENVLPAKADV